MIANKILLLVCDCLRYDYWHYGFNKAFGPSLPNWFAVSHCSDPNFASLYTGKLPQEHGVVMQEARELDLPDTLMKIARAEGMATLSVTEARAPEFYRSGCDVVYHSRRGRGTAFLLAKHRMPAFLTENDRYFAAIRLLDTHEPYIGAIAKTAEETRYLSGVLTALNICKQLVDLAKDALVIITADHGQMLGEHGELGHTSGMYDELLHVPFWCSSNAFKDDGVYQHDCLFNYLVWGLTFRHSWPLVFQGMAGIEGKIGWMSAVRTESIKLIKNASVEGDGISLYDLQDDPRERCDLATLLVGSPPLDRKDRAQLTERLKSLGYM